MDIRKSRQPRHLFVEARIMLHRAGPERIDSGVNCVVLLAETHIVPHGLRLREPRQTDLTTALQAAEPRRYQCRLSDIDSRILNRSQLKKERLFDLQCPIARERFRRIGA